MTAKKDPVFEKYSMEKTENININKRDYNNILKNILRDERKQTLKEVILNIDKEIKELEEIYNTTKEFTRLWSFYRGAVVNLGELKAELEKELNR